MSAESERVSRSARPLRWKLAAGLIARSFFRREDPATRQLSASDLQAGAPQPPARSTELLRWETPKRKSAL